jgi:hypothetical protein
MAQTWHRVRIEEDSDDLLEALSVRGLEAHPVEGGEIEVAAFGEEGIWNLEVVSALETWLEGEHRDEVTARLGDAVYTVRSPEARAIDDTGEFALPGPRRRRTDPVALAAALGIVLLLAAGVWLLLAAGFQLL